MRKLAVMMVGAMAVLGFAMPASAHDYSWRSRHDWQHDRLDRRHDAIHDELEEEHDEAHDQGLSPWEHRRLHQELEYQHELADHQLERRHARQHRRDSWRRYYGNRGYYGY